MISPERLITDITAAACSAARQHVRVCLFPIFSPACGSICERPRFTSGPGKRVFVLMEEVLVRAGTGWRASTPPLTSGLRKLVSHLPSLSRARTASPDHVEKILNSSCAQGRGGDRAAAHVRVRVCRLCKHPTVDGSALTGGERERRLVVGR